MRSFFQLFLTGRFLFVILPWNIVLIKDTSNQKIKQEKAHQKRKKQNKKTTFFSIIFTTDNGI